MRNSGSNGDPGSCGSGYVYPTSFHEQCKLASTHLCCEVGAEVMSVVLELYELAWSFAYEPVVKGLELHDRLYDIAIVLRSSLKRMAVPGNVRIWGEPL